MTHKLTVVIEINTSRPIAVSDNAAHVSTERDARKEMARLQRIYETRGSNCNVTLAKRVAAIRVAETLRTQLTQLANKWPLE